MPNQYSVPRVNTHERVYAGMPLEEMEKLAQYKQLDYTTLLDKQQETSDYVGGIQGYGDWAKSQLDARKQEDEKFVKQFDGVDLTLPQYRKQIGDYSKQIANDQMLNKISTDALQINEYYSNKKKAAEDQNFAPELIWAHEKALENYSATGDLSNFSPSVRKGNEVLKDMQALYSMIKESGGDIKIGLENADGTGLLTGWGSKGVSLNTLNDHTNRILNQFAASPSGQQERDRYLMLADMNGVQPTDKGFKAFLREELNNVAAGYAHGTTSYEKRTDNNLDAADKEDKKKKEAASVNVAGYTFPVGLSKYKFSDAEGSNMKPLFDRDGDIIEANPKHPEASGGMKPKDAAHLRTLTQTYNDTRRSGEPMLTPRDYTALMNSKDKFSANMQVSSNDEELKGLQNNLIGTELWKSLPIYDKDNINGAPMDGASFAQNLTEDAGIGWMDGSLDEKEPIKLQSSTPVPMPNGKMGLPVVFKMSDGTESKTAFIAINDVPVKNMEQAETYNRMRKLQVMAHPDADNTFMMYNSKGELHKVRGVLGINGEPRFKQLD